MGGRRIHSCSIPAHCIDPRRLPLFIARSALRDLIAGLHADAKGCRRHDDLTAQERDDRAIFRQWFKDNGEGRASGSGCLGAMSLQRFWRFATG